MMPENAAALAPFELLAQAFEFFADLREPPRYRYFIPKKDGPHNHPRRKKKFEVFHPFILCDAGCGRLCACALRDSIS